MKTADIKNKTITGLTYTGKVNLKIIKGDKVVKTISLKNKGRQLLFKVVASALCGYGVQNAIPKYLDFGYLDDDDKFHSALANRVSVTGRVVENETIMLGANTQLNKQVGALFSGYIPNTSVLK